MLHKAWNSKEEMPYCFPSSSIKFQGHTGQNITEFDPNWAFPDYRPVAAFKSLRFALFLIKSRHTSPHTEFAGVSVRSYVDLSPYCEIWAPLHELKLISSLWWINPTNSLLIWPQLIQMLCEQFADHPHAADTHHDDVIMIAMASQITSLTIVYSTLYLGTDERKHQSSASLAFVKGIHRWPVNSPHERPVARKMFPFDDVIMHRSSIDSRYLGATVVQRPIQCITNKSFQHYLLCFYYGYIQNHISNKNESGVCSVEKCQLKPHDTQNKCFRIMSFS